MRLLRYFDWRISMSTPRAPRVGGSAAALVKAADAQLYLAKSRAHDHACGRCRPAADHGVRTRPALPGGAGVTYVVSKLAGACAAEAVLADSNSAKSAAKSGLL